MTSVKKSVAGVATTIAAMTPGTDLSPDRARYCFRKVADYAGTADTALMASTEKLGSWVGSGQANGGNLPCLVVDFDEISGSNAGKPVLFVMKRTDDSFEANLRKTAYELQCQ